MTTKEAWIKRKERYGSSGTQNPNLLRYWKDKEQSKESNEKRSKASKTWFQNPSNHQKFLEAHRKAHLGKLRLFETKRKISTTRKLRHFHTSTEYKKGHSFSPETLNKISHTQKEKWENKEYKERCLKAIIKGSIKRPTSFEQKIIELILKNNLPFEYVGDGQLLICFRNPDFINNNGKKLLIETYCSVWHPEDYEITRSRLFGKYGFRTLFLSEHDLERQDWESHCLEKIEEFTTWQITVA